MAVKHSDNRRGRNAHGQLAPLNERETPARAAARQERNRFRLGMAQHIGNLTFMVNQHTSVLNRGLFGRLKWALLGK